MEKQNKPDSKPASETQSSSRSQVEPDMFGLWTDPQLAALEQRYPYMFAPPNLGLSMHAGWLPVFEQLCADIDARLGDDKRGFHWQQIKERFGYARWYWQMKVKSDQMRDFFPDQDEIRMVIKKGPEDEVLEIVIELVRVAIAKTETLCMACGRPAIRRQYQNWLVVCCEEHFEVLKRSTSEFFHLVYPD